jgi:predicted permease
MDSFRRDVRYAVRSLVRSPGFATITILTLALGIGATTALFSVVHGVLLRPLPYPEPDRIVQIWQVNDGSPRNNISDPNFEDLRTQSRSFAAMAQVGNPVPVTVIGAADPRRATAVPVSRDFFAALGVSPAIGRAFVAEEQQLAGAPAVIVSHRFWQQELGGARDLSNRTLTFANRVYSVVGVMPPSFAYPAGVDLYIAREMTAPLPSRSAHNWRAVGRLGDGVTLEAAQRDLTSIARRVKAQYGDETLMIDAAAIPLHEQLVGPVRTPLFILLGAAGVLLLIACANVTNLFLARMAARQRELAVRVAMGAGTKDLVKQYMMESLILSLAAGVIGVVLAMIGVRALLALEPGNLPRVAEVGVNWPVLLFALVISVLTALALGLFAALRGVTDDLRTALAESQRSLAGGGNRVRNSLTVAQVAMTLVLLVGAGLLGRSLVELLTVDPGYRTDGAVVIDLAMPFPADPGMEARQTRTYEELLARIAAIPGVASAGGVNVFPLRGGGPNGSFVILAHAAEQIEMSRIMEIMKDPARSGYAEFRVASEGYFDAMRIPLIRGRLFDGRDAPTAPHAAVISESLAAQEFADQDPIGRYIQFGNMDGVMTPYMVVGIVGDVRDRSLEVPSRPTFYGYFRQRPRPASTFSVVIATSVDPGQIVAPVRAALREVAPELPPRIATLEEVVAGSVADRRFSLLLFGAFASAALLLAMLGVYSVISYLVAQREHEIGIRVALGARRSDVLILVIRHATLLVGTGVVLGIAAAVALTRLIEGLLYGVSATDPVAFAGVVALVVAVALVASWLPARRATQVDPMTVLRSG